jgi:hypothetical protein
MSFALALTIGALAAGCEDETTQPEDDSIVLPAPTTPEALIFSIEVLYNDKVHTADERLAGYASLFDSTFTFHFQPADINNGLPPSWGLEEELAAHASIFAAYGAGDTYSIELRITHNPAQDETPPQVGHEGWKQIFATNVYLRVMFNIEDGLEVNGGQAEFLFPPATEGRSLAPRFRIAEWTDLPRPGIRSNGPRDAPRSAVESSTWGSIKASYR